MIGENRCPQCNSGIIKGWDELNEEEREVVKRLPASADEPLETRLFNRWCTRCWYEETQSERHA